jgi:hypothetical protein
MRIVTRPDFDGVVCAVLIGDALSIESPVRWVEPNDFAKGTVDIRPGDVVANLPYHAACDIWFDHHSTNRTVIPFKGLFRPAPSAARNVFDYFQGRFTRDYDDLVYWADRIDSADFTQTEVLHPERTPHILLSMTVSGEKGNDETYWNHLVALLRASAIDRVMADPEVAARCRRVEQENGEYAGWLLQYTRVVGEVAITDFRALERPPSGNRFLSYSLFPETVVSVRIRYEDASRETVVVNIGHSIFNPHCRVHAGRLLTAFGGGGHRGAASARFPADQAASYIPQIIDALVRNQDEPAGAPAV